METWVKDIIGLTIAFDSVAIIAAFTAAFFYEAGKPYINREYVYKNYNYTITNKDTINADV